jgi:GT2 family glycosyltransferase
MRTAKARWEDHGCRVEHIGLLPRPTGYASGEAFLIRAAAVRSTGVFDETFFSYYEDAELSMRLRRDGWGIDVVPSAVVDHIVGASGSSVRGAFYRGRNGVLFLRRAGRSRVSAVICSAVPLFVGIGSHLRSGRVKVAFNGLLRGWFAGAIEAVRSS